MSRRLTPRAVSEPVGENADVQELNVFLPPLFRNHSLQLPEELVDIILDEFDATASESLNPSLFPDRDTLRLCALVSRVFARLSQKRLFSTVDTVPQDHYSHLDSANLGPVHRFSNALLSSPHLGVYVLVLVLPYSRYADKQKVVNYLARVQPFLPRLRTIHMVSCRLSWQLYPEINPVQRIQINPSQQGTLSRRLEIKSNIFADVDDLQLVLSNVASLTELALYNVQFRLPARVTVDPPATTTPHVTIKSLELVGISRQDIDTLLHSFHLIDIRHLSSFLCDIYPNSVLTVNARSIEELTLLVGPDRAVIPEPDRRAAGIPPLARLHTLNLRIQLPSALPNLLPLLEPFMLAKDLRGVSITTHKVLGEPFATRYWSAMDSLLAAAGPALEWIRIDFSTKPEYHDLEDVFERIAREALPQAEAKGILNIRFLNPDRIKADLRLNQ
ncbi:hypothetical protein C8R46DRAFT_1107036 [Mycena filopes]|nr:hypothetical protein C8R46DRAFT_1107036 [Mycena filopes]